ncbi:MAG: hypothetical protein JXL97_03005 [Bacteroidales bacterium]|nr:hypothetical protein [Bacteroidales bacterium]
MKSILQLIIFSLITFSGLSQSNSKIIGIWNGGYAFGGEYTDSLLVFQFNKNNEFHFQYGPNHYDEYNNYQINGDTLFLLQNSGFQEAAFIIEELTNSILIIQAINWSAVYITSDLCSPWSCNEKPQISIDADFETENILNNDVLNTKLEFEILK